MTYHVKRGEILRQVLTYTFPLQSPPSRINLNSHSDDIWNTDEKRLLFLSAAFISLNCWNQKQQQHKDPGIGTVQSVWHKHKQHQDTKCTMYQLIQSNILKTVKSTDGIYQKKGIFTSKREAYACNIRYKYLIWDNGIICSHSLNVKWNRYREGLQKTNAQSIIMKLKNQNEDTMTLI